MTSPIGSKATKDAEMHPARGRLGFTLIELILVMAMLTIILSVTAPSLSRFFQGRTLDAEAKRFLGLTRYGQSRAVSEGIPMILWIDEVERSYGLEAEPSYLEDDSKALVFDMHEDVQLEVLLPASTTATFSLQRASSVGQRILIRLTPDGFIGENCPEWIVFRQNQDDEVWLGPSRNRLNYEVKPANELASR
jgi:prepilin-type N-terminal cleavage/methylation domain-containing protein